MHLLPKCHLERNTELRRSRVLNVLIYHPEEVESVEYVLSYRGILSTGRPSVVVFRFVFFFGFKSQCYMLTGGEL